MAGSDVRDKVERASEPTKRSVNWPVLLLSLPAAVAIWSGWVALGTLCGFGKVEPLPGLLDGFVIDTRITLPVGMETYAAYALRVWLTSPAGLGRMFAKWSTIAALTLGAAGQVAYHLMSAAGVTAAPWPVVALVATLPVAVLGMGAALAHLTHTETPNAAREVVDPAAGDDALTREGPAKTAKTAKTPFPQVSGHEFWQNGPAKTPARPAKTPAKGTRRAPATTAAAAETAATVRALAAANPGWTQAQIAAEAGCSVRTVRRHLTSGNTSGPAPATTPEPVAEPVARPLLEPVPAQIPESSESEGDAA